MGELLVIVSEKNDIVYQRMFNKVSDEEYCRFMIIVYGSIDVLMEKMLSSTTNYFASLDTYGDAKVSAYVMPSGYKLLFMHSRSDVKQFLDNAHKVFAGILLKSAHSDVIADNPDLNRSVDELYSSYFV
ncbi:putative sedlin [Ordospora colligata]|uniref:Putative sedlin n=1 Tax=Ordospora colligata OC4 TaxID=1354746 RepID=A0A0B2UM11_9MICR|nr:putative sedlin [Ordospora colligata OC4]KHN70107.1 putative sedlin [Ordospora colligata OC4]TBU16489.1 putative sedlin [Ordospora colligata]TBU16674.1 putative sedlin [Ordospora colligata]TBU19247.1 putative sedlin [Ordospora colligata]